MKKGFNNEQYVKLQTEVIEERIKMFNGKLYLEFGGKLFDDYHAQRILPGFELNSKIRLLEKLKDSLEIIFCINAGDIARKKIRADYGITYDMELIRLVKILTKKGLKINSVAINLYDNQPGVDIFEDRLHSLGIKTYKFTPTKGYPTDVEVIVSEEGYGKNPYIKTTKPLVVVTAPGPNSGKLATCLSQLYHEYKHGVKAGYAKFETFPVWDLPLDHPVNIAYEAATADLNDKNMVDHFHLEAYGKVAINYNRDLEVFPVLEAILKKITGEKIYASPTDMGVNSIGRCIVDDDAVRLAANKEIIRRYYKALTDYKLGRIKGDVVQRIKLLLNNNYLDVDLLPVIKPALEKQEKTNKRSAAIELSDGFIITGRETDIFTPVSSTILNAIKVLAGIEDDFYLITPELLNNIVSLKRQIEPEKYLLTLNEVLIALSASTSTNPLAEKALQQLSKLTSLDLHSSYILENGDLKTLRDLKINFTSEPEFYTERLFKKHQNHKI